MEAANFVVANNLIDRAHGHGLLPRILIENPLSRTLGHREKEGHRRNHVAVTTKDVVNLLAIEIHEFQSGLGEVFEVGSAGIGTGAGNLGLEVRQVQTSGLIVV